MTLRYHILDGDTYKYLGEALNFKYSRGLGKLELCTFTTYKIPELKVGNDVNIVISDDKYNWYELMSGYIQKITEKDDLYSVEVVAKTIDLKNEMFRQSQYILLDFEDYTEGETPDKTDGNWDLSSTTLSDAIDVRIKSNLSFSDVGKNTLLFKDLDTNDNYYVEYSHGVEEVLKGVISFGVYIAQLHEISTDVAVHYFSVDFGSSGTGLTFSFRKNATTYDVEMKIESGATSSGWITIYDMSSTGYSIGKFFNITAYFDYNNDSLAVYVNGEKIYENSSFSFDVGGSSKLIFGSATSYISVFLYDNIVVYDLTEHISNPSSNYIRTKPLFNQETADRLLYYLGYDGWSYYGNEDLFDDYAINISTTNNSKYFMTSKILRGCVGIKHYKYDSFNKILYVGKAQDDTTLKLQLKFNEGDGTTAYDGSNYNNDGTINGAKWVEGKYGWALEFDGTNDYVVVSDDSSLDITDALTISAWLRPTDITTNATYTILRKDESYRISFQNNGQTLSFGLWDSGGTLNELDVSIDSEEIVDGRWHLVVATYDGSFMKLYLDGKLIGYKEDIFSIQSTANDLYIGSNGGSSEFYKGYMDEIRIYAKTFDEDMVSDLYKFGEYYLTVDYDEDYCKIGETNGLMTVNEKRKVLSSDEQYNKITITGYNKSRLPISASAGEGKPEKTFYYEEIATKSELEKLADEVLNYYKKQSGYEVEGTFYCYDHTKRPKKLLLETTSNIELIQSTYPITLHTKLIPLAQPCSLFTVYNSYNLSIENNKIVFRYYDGSNVNVVQSDDISSLINKNEPISITLMISENKEISVYVDKVEVINFTASTMQKITNSDIYYGYMLFPTVGSIATHQFLYELYISTDVNKDLLPRIFDGDYPMRNAVVLLTPYTVDKTDEIWYNALYQRPYVFGLVADLHIGQSNGYYDYNKKLSRKMLLGKTDYNIYLGDLFEDTTDDRNDFINTFKNLEAKEQIFVWGNHDYGDGTNYTTHKTKLENNGFNATQPYLLQFNDNRWFDLTNVYEIVDYDTENYIGVEFDGSERYDFTNNETYYTFTHKLTIETTVVPDDITNITGIVQKVLNFGLDFKDGVLRFSIYDQSSNSHVLESDENVFEVGKKYDIKCIYEDQKLKMYINGSLHKEMDLPNDIYIPDNTETIYVGSAGSSGSAYFKGKIYKLIVKNKNDEIVLNLDKNSASNYNWYDISPIRNHPTKNGSPSISQYNKAYLINGTSDYIQIEDPQNYENDFTIELMFKLHSITGSDVIAWCSASDYTNKRWYLATRLNRLAFYIYEDDATAHMIVGNQTLETDKIYKVHLVRKGTKAYIYINGELDNEIDLYNLFSLNSSSTSYIYIGSEIGVAPADMTFYSLKIFPYGFTENQVRYSQFASLLNPVVDLSEYDVHDNYMIDNAKQVKISNITGGVQVVDGDNIKIDGINTVREATHVRFNKQIYPIDKIEYESNKNSIKYWFDTKKVEIGEIFLSMLKEIE